MIDLYDILKQLDQFILQESKDNKDILRLTKAAGELLNYHNISQKVYKSEVVLFSEGWIYFDLLGKDYGPWSTHIEALTLGPIQAAKEEKLLRNRYQ